MLLSVARSQARAAAAADKAVPTATPPAPSARASGSSTTAKKQRTMHDFFVQDSAQQTARKKKKKKRGLSTPGSAARTPDEPVQKRIEYDSPAADASMGDGAAPDKEKEEEEEEEDSQEIVGSSQASEAARTPLHPRPKKIDFSHYASQASEPDLEPNGRLFPPSESAVFGGTVDRGTPSYSQRHGGYAFSQDEMDFLTPLDQPVMHLSHPTTPSPLKKRHRRSTSADMGRDVEVQHITHDMTHMDVRRAGQPLPSISTDSMPSPVANDDAAGELFSPSTDMAVLGASAFIANGKRKLARPLKEEAASEPEPIDTFTNPFAPLPSDSGRKKRPRRRRPSFPAAWSSGGSGAGAVPPVSKYLSDFVEQEMVGSGSFSKVFKCLKKIDGWVYAVKKSKRHFRGKADTERALREVQALAALSDSRHIVRYFDAWIEDDLLYIQLEFCKGCSLAEMVDRFKPQPIPEPTLCKILSHLSQALHDMHSKKIVHMDVKLQNVLVGDGDVYKLGDLGTVAHMDGSMEITEGDNRYLSRELLEGNRTNLRAGDIFALGATIYELALGRSLPSNGEEWQRLRDGDLAMFRQYSNSLQHLIAGMMHPDPLQRPSAEEILQHEVVLPFRECL